MTPSWYRTRPSLLAVMVKVSLPPWYEGSFWQKSCIHASFLRYWLTTPLRRSCSRSSSVKDRVT